MKDLLKSEKLIKFAFISGIVAIALIFLSDFGKSTETAVTDEQALEQRITEMLTAMDGIDEVPNVTVRLDEDKHTVLGITVVCPQAISNRTAERAINAVRTALDVSASKICITTQSEVFIMKRPRINLILGKKHLVAAGLALVLAVGLYANFAIGSSADGKNVSGDNYGDTRLVSNEKSKTEANTDKDSDIVATAAKSDIRSDSASDSEEYFAKARIDKQASREEAKETLKSIYGSGDMTKDELAVVAQDAKQLTDLMEAENKINNAQRSRRRALRMFFAISATTAPTLS